MGEIMQHKVFTVVGNTVDEEKYACKIKKALMEAGYTVYAVGKELMTLDEIPAPSIEVLDLCINPNKGLMLIKECSKPIERVLIQPGAGSDEIKALLDERGIPWLDDCALKGLEKMGK